MSQLMANLASTQIPNEYRQRWIAWSQGEELLLLMKSKIERRTNNAPKTRLRREMIQNDGCIGMDHEMFSIKGNHMMNMFSKGATQIKDA
jgi:hypothetical protein